MIYPQRKQHVGVLTPALRSCQHNLSRYVNNAVPCKRIPGCYHQTSIDCASDCFGNTSILIESLVTAICRRTYQSNLVWLYGSIGIEEALTLAATRRAALNFAVIVGS